MLMAEQVAVELGGIMVAFLMLACASIIVFLISIPYMVEALQKGDVLFY